MTNADRRVLVINDRSSTDEVVDIIDALERAGFATRLADDRDNAASAAAVFRPDLAVVAVGAGGDAALDAVGLRRELERDHGLPVVVLGGAAIGEHKPAAAGPSGADPAKVRPIADAAGSQDDVARLDRMVDDVADAMADDRVRTRPVLAAGDLVIDEAGRLALRADQPLELTRREFDLLVHLVRRRNRVVSKDDLQATVWAHDAVTVNAIEARVSKLRAKLDAAGPRLIHTVRGIGYVLRVPGTAPIDPRRAAILADRERILRERDEAITRRDDLRQQRERLDDFSRSGSFTWPDRHRR